MKTSPLNKISKALNGDTSNDILEQSPAKKQRLDAESRDALDDRMDSSPLRQVTEADSLVIPSSVLSEASIRSPAELMDKDTFSSSSCTIGRSELEDSGLCSRLPLRQYLSEKPVLSQDVVLAICATPNCGIDIGEGESLLPDPYSRYGVICDKCWDHFHATLSTPKQNPIYGEHLDLPTPSVCSQCEEKLATMWNEDDMVRVCTDCWLERNAKGAPMPKHYFRCNDCGKHMLSPAWDDEWICKKCFLLKVASEGPG